MRACGRSGNADNNIYPTEYHGLTPGKDGIDPLAFEGCASLPDRSSSQSTEVAEPVEECEYISPSVIDDRWQHSRI